MPSFPASVKSFTTKLDGAGNPINAAHVNDLQDEVNAIEAGYLNGSARLNSSASTVASLSVIGDSTLATLYVTTPPPHARVNASTALQLANGTHTPVSFNVDRFLSVTSMHSTTTNPTRLIAPSSGVYLMTGDVACSTIPGANESVLLAQIRLNGTTLLARQAFSLANSSQTNQRQNVATIYNLAANDYVELVMFQNSGSSGSVIVGTSTDASTPEFSLVKIR